VRPTAVVERDPGADASAGLTAIGILLEIHLFVLERPPQSLDSN
jgi:hypothetical protein